MAKAIIVIDDETGTDKLAVHIKFSPPINAQQAIPPAHQAALDLIETINRKGEN